MADISCQIVKHVAVLSTSESGYTKELNLVSWNGAEPKVDLRTWSPGHERSLKGLTMTVSEAEQLHKALNKMFS